MKYIITTSMLYDLTDNISHKSLKIFGIYIKQVFSFNHYRYINLISFDQ